jgi:hypothetical protein
MKKQKKKLNDIKKTVLKNLLQTESKAVKRNSKKILKELEKS